MNTPFHLWYMLTGPDPSRTAFESCARSGCVAVADLFSLEEIGDQAAVASWCDFLDRHRASWPTRVGIRAGPALLARIADRPFFASLGVVVVADDGSAVDAARFSALARRGAALVWEFSPSRPCPLPPGLPDLLLVRGYESGGISRDASVRTLFDQARASCPETPIVVQGIESPELAAVFLALGASGFALDASPFLLPPTDLSEPVREELRKPREGCLRRQHHREEWVRVEYAAASLLDQPPLPVGPALFLCRDLTAADPARRLAAFRQQTNATLDRLRELQSADLAAKRGDPFLIQGPMARITHRVPFAAALSRSGFFPVMSLTGLGSDEVRTLTLECASAPDLPAYGLGIAGTPAYAPSDLTRWCKDKPPAFLVVASDLWALRDAWKPVAPLWLHVQTPAMVDDSLREGHRTLLLEGCESGGHVGYLPGTILWPVLLRHLRDHAAAGPAPRLVLAGGIHDAASVLFGLLLVRAFDFEGEVSFQVGTPLLLTPEAVATGALPPAYARRLLESRRTRVLGPGSGVGLRAAVPLPAFAGTASPKEQAFAAYANALEGSETGLFLAGESIAQFSSPVDLRALERNLNGSADLWNRRHAAVPSADTLDFRIARPAGSLDLAVVGLGGLFPGAADTAEFWENLQQNRRQIVEVPPDYWGEGRYREEERDADLTPAEKTYSWHAGMVRSFTFDKFDCLKFRVTPRAAEGADRIHLMLLKAIEQAVESAGPRFRFPPDTTAVFIGNSMGGERSKTGALRTHLSDILTLLERTTVAQNLPADARRKLLEELAAAVHARFPAVTEDTLVGVVSSTLGGRIASYLNVRGGNFSVDAACASSPAALMVAAGVLASGTAECAVVGGVDSDLTADTFINFSKLHALSHGISRPFMEGSDGFTMGEGTAILLLKPFDLAVRDGDPVYARVLGVGMSSDGRGGSLTLPSPEGQMLALRRAFAQSGFAPETVGLVEAHGTGTPAGDAVELEVLQTVFADARPGQVALGSVKSHIGHLKSAAGIASLVKAVLALHHRTLPPAWIEGNVRRELTGPRVPFRLLPAARPWPKRGCVPRRAAVSSFGFGGSNFHVHLEEMDEKLRLLAPSRLFLFSGTDRRSVDAKVAAFLEAVAQAGSVDPTDAAQLCFLGGEGPCRLAVVWNVTSPWPGPLKAFRADAPLPAADDPQTLWFRDSCPRQKLAFLFPGQGSVVHAPFRLFGQTVASFACDLESSEIALGTGNRMRDVLWPASPDTDGVSAETRAANPILQPATTALSLALTRMLADLGIRPDATAGHSLGFYAALFAAGVLSGPDVLRLVRQRAACFESFCRQTPGCMIAIFADETAVRALLARSPHPFHVANVNSPNQTVVSLPTGGAPDVENFLASENVRYQRLAVPYGFHSPLMAAAAAAFEDSIRSLAYRTPRTDLYSETTGARVPPESFAGGYPAWLPRHITEPVQFAAVARALAQDGVGTFLEVGARGTLSRFVRDTLPPGSARCLTLDTPTDHPVHHLHRVLAELYVEAGVPVDFGGYAELMAGHLRPVRVAQAPAPAAVVPEAAPPAPAPSLAAAPTTAAPVAEDETFRKVRAIVARHTGFDENLIAADRPLQDTLGIDSLKMIEIGLEIEKTFGVKLADAALPQSVTLAGLVERVRNPASPAETGAPARAQRFVLTARPVPPPRPAADREGAIAFLAHEEDLCRLWEKKGYGPARRIGPLTLSDLCNRIGSLPLSRLSGIVYLAPPEIARNGEDDVWRRVFLPAYALGHDLVPRLAAARAGGRGFRLLTASRDVCGEIGAGLSGFSRSLPWEFPDLSFGHVSCAGRRPPADLLRILRDEAADNGTPFRFVRYTGARRWVDDLEPADAAADAEAILRPNDVVLATGGGHGITAEILVSLAETASASWILVGSTDADDASPVAARVRDTMARLRKHGSRVRYLRCDLGDPAAVRALARELNALKPRLTGVIHGAGVLADRGIAHKSAEDFFRVIAVKAGSARILQRTLDLSSLRFWINLSSIASHLGNAGQCDYAAANAYLNRQAETLRRKALSLAKAVLWSPWSGVGMAADERMQQMLRSRNVAVIAPEDGVRFMDVEMRSRDAPCVAYTADPVPLSPLRRNGDAGLWSETRVSGAQVRLVSRDFRTEEPFLDHHRIQGAAILPGVAVLGLGASVMTPAGVSVLWRNVRFQRPVLPGNGALRLAMRWTGTGPRSGRFEGGRADETQAAFDGEVLWSVPRPAFRVPALKSATLTVHAPADLYGAGRLLFSGPVFQAIARTVRVRTTGAETCLEGRESLWTDAPDVVSAAPLTCVDGLFQIAALYGRARTGGAYLPTAVGSLWWSGAPLPRRPLAALVWSRGAAASGTLTFDGVIRNGRRALVILRGLVLTLASGKSSRGDDPGKTVVAESSVAYGGGKNNA